MKTNKKIIVFSPHPDDETLSCGGTIVKKLSEGYDVIVVLLTDGRNAFSSLFGIDTGPTPNELKETRKQEVTRASKILGLTESALLFLDFEDGTLKKNQGEIKKKVIEVLSRNNPVEVYFTYGKDRNPDHRIASRIIRDSIKELGLDTIECLYSVDREYKRLRAVTDKLFNLFRHNMIRVDISKFLSIKETALKEFKSQVTIISRKQKRPVIENIERFLKNEEIFFIRQKS